MLFNDKPVVLDLTRLLPGPYGTFLMASFGMEVIKIEDKGQGDYLKTLAAVEDEEESLIYRLLNGNKRKIFLDLKNENDKEEFKKMVKNAKVVAESFRPGVMERLGLGYDTLKEINPQLIFINIGGYLDKSPKSARAGHDLNYMAESGILGNTGKNGPEMIGTTIADLTGGLAMFGMIAGALYRQQLTKQGMYLKIGIDELVASWGNVYGSFLGKPHQYPEVGKAMLGGGIVCYNIYKAKDGSIALAALEEKFWNNFIQAINRPDLKPAQLTEASPENPYYIEISNYFAERTRQEILELMREADCCISPILTLKEAVPEDESEQLQKFTDFYEYKL